MLFVGQSTADDLVSLKKGQNFGLCLWGITLSLLNRWPANFGGKIPKTNPIPNYSKKAALSQLPEVWTLSKNKRYRKKEYLQVYRFQHQEVFRDRYPNGGTNRKEKSSSWFQLELPRKTRHFIIQDKSSRYCTASRTGGLVPNQPNLWPLLDLIQLSPALWCTRHRLLLWV